MPRSGVDLAAAERAIDKRKLKEELVRTAEAVAVAAKALAPVGTVARPSRGRKPGDYRRGIKVVVRGQRVYVAGKDFKSHWIEWGSVNNTPRAPLRRGVRALGLRLDEREKPG